MCPLPSVDPGWLVSHLPCVRWYHCCEYRPPAGYFSHRTPAPKLEAEDVSLGGMAMKFASSLFSKKATWQPVLWSDSAFGIFVANDPVPIFHQIRKSMQSISLSTYSSNGALINQRTTRLHGSPEKPNEFRATSCWTSARSGRWLSGTAATSLVNLGESEIHLIHGRPLRQGPLLQCNVFENLKLVQNKDQWLTKANWNC